MASEISKLQTDTLYTLGMEGAMRERNIPQTIKSMWYERRLLGKDGYILFNERAIAQSI